MTAPRWVGGLGARAEGPFAPGGQPITLLVIRSDRVQHHIRWYRERDPENGYPDRRPSTPGRSPTLKTAARTSPVGLDCGSSPHDSGSLHHFRPTHQSRKALGPDVAAGERDADTLPTE